MNLHLHVQITQSSKFALGFTLSFVHCVGLDRYVMTSVHHYSFVQGVFYCLKNLLCSAFSSFTLLQSQKPLFFFFFKLPLNCAFSRMAYSQNQTVCAFSDWLFSLSNPYTFKVLSHLFMTWLLIFSYFFFSAEYSFVWICHSLSIYSPIEGHLDCFQILAIMNNAAINTTV